jgi:cation-transporting ATPase E
MMNSLPPPFPGLTEAEALARRQRGQGNDAQAPITRTYLQILVNNAFTFINTVLFAIGGVLILMGKYGDAFVTAGLVLLNVIVGVYQEARAKRKLEQIALLTRPKATVIRDGQPKTVDPEDVVLGDLLRLDPGDQVVVDGQIVGEGRVELDESLLTGESELARKQAGDPVYSGSYCMVGSTVYVAEKVGVESFVNQLSAGARAYRQTKTPLQREIDWIVRILVLLVTQLGILLGLSFWLQRVPVVDSVRTAAVIVALVPQGLFFMTTVAYAMGAVRVAGQGALIQQASAVEATSHVNLLCMDKTGTLTTNRIRLESILPLQADEAGLKRLVGDYAASTVSGNRTTVALAEALPGQARRVVDEVLFSSEWKWSALVSDEPDFQGIYVLGAPEKLAPALQPGSDLGPPINVWTQQGLRVLLFAHQPNRIPLHDATGEPRLPEGLIPLGWLCFSDELRPEARETLQHFAELGIRPKIISGDNPQTVAALARQLGLPADARLVSGLDLAAMDEAQFAQAASDATIFGRITPQQKERLVRLFRDQGHTVAMIGDGVNDVLSLKQAHVGVAMQSGSPAARGVADIVLLGDSFAALPGAFREGQRIVKGMEDVVRLLVTRTFYVLLLIVSTQIVGVAFPVTPKHNSLLALLTVGIPILAIAAWARPGAPPRSVVRSTSRFVFPAAFTVSIMALAVYLYVLSATGDLDLARSALTTVTVLCGLVLILFVEPPTPAWVGGDELSGDWRPAALALAMLGLFGLILALPGLRGFFELRLLRIGDYGVIVGGVTAWALLLRLIWRGQWFERLLKID